ncbi:MAG: hypothetical protein ACI4MA_08300 [Treponema sp.]
MKTERKELRLEKEFLTQIEEKAALEKMSATEFIEYAIKKELYSDINIQNELLAKFELMHSDINRVSKNLDVLASIFLYYLKYYFSIEKAEIDNISPEMRNAVFEQGEKRRNSFIANFKKENRHLKSLFEVLLADYLVKAVE